MSEYRRLLRDTVITSSLKIKPKRLSREKRVAHDRELARLWSVYEARGDHILRSGDIDPQTGDPVTDATKQSIAARTNGYGDVEPGAKYAARRIQIVAEIERLCYQGEAHNTKVRATKQRRCVRDAQRQHDASIMDVLGLAY
jgi:hypothetical protein